MILVGDCLDVMKTLDADSIDAIVTDPPYGLGFMGKAWDHAVPGGPFWVEMLRVAKPGAFLLAFCGTRTDHRMKCAIEDAGWEIRDTIMWVYGSGFPKSHNGEWGGTALKPAWEPITLARKPVDGTVAKNFAKYGTGGLNIAGCRIGSEGGSNIPSGMDRFNAANAAAGYRPEAYAKGEPPVPEPMGRWPANLIHDGSEEVVGLFPKTSSPKPYVKKKAGWLTPGATHAENELQSAEYGDTGSAARFFAQHQHSDEDWIWQHLSLAPTAGSNLSLQNDHVAFALSDAATLALPEGMQCAVSTAPSTTVTASELRRLATSLIGTIRRSASAFWLGPQHVAPTQNDSPVNVAVAREPTGTTTITVSRWKSDGSAEPVTFTITATNSEPGAKDSARFRYCAKTSRKDRNEGCEGMAEKAGGSLNMRNDAHAHGNVPAARENNHPTVKPTDLMRYLCRLVTPKGGTILDPFMGSGSTGKAATLEGFAFTGIELDPEYALIAAARIEAAKAKPAPVIPPLGLFGEEQAA